MVSTLTRKFTSRWRLVHGPVVVASGGVATVGVAIDKDVGVAVDVDVGAVVEVAVAVVILAQVWNVLRHEMCLRY